MVFGCCGFFVLIGIVLSKSVKSVQSLDDDIVVVNVIRAGDPVQNICQVSTNCNVTCSSGKVNLVLSIIEGQIEDHPSCVDTLTYLRISDAEFENGQLSRNWLTINPAIDSLTLIGCYITDILPGAFNSSHFTDTKTLTLKQLPIQHLRLGMFLGFKRLLNLVLDTLPLVRIDPNVMLPLMNTLTTLHFESMLYALDPRNLTGTSYLNVLQVVSIQHCQFFDVVDDLTFSGLKKVTSFYLRNNSITSLHPATFRTMERSVKQIYLEENRLEVLPEGVFDMFAQRQLVTIYLKANPWDCNCELQHLQMFMRHHLMWFPDNPRCQAPEDLLSQLLVEAELCPFTEVSPETTEASECGSSEEGGCEITTEFEVTTTTSSTTSTTASTSTTTKFRTTTTTTATTTSTPTPTTTTTTTTETTSTTTTTTTTTTISTTPATEGTTTTQEATTTSSQAVTTGHPFETVSLFCDRSNLQELVLTRSIPRFHVQDLEPGVVEITLETLALNMAVIWFYANSDISTIAQWNNDLDKGCLLNVQSSFRIQHLRPSTLYMFCLMPQTWNVVSPLGCTPHLTLPHLGENVWLYNDDISTFVMFSVILLTLTGVLGALLAYFAVRRKPSLIRGSKRVVVVGNRTNDVMVMPPNFDRRKTQRRTQPNVYHGSNGMVIFQGGSQRQTKMPNIDRELVSYMSPMPNHMSIEQFLCQRRMSDSSIGSCKSYVSIGPPSRKDTASTWRMESIPKEPPPLPPFPPMSRNGTMMSRQRLSGSVHGKGMISFA